MSPDYILTAGLIICGIAAIGAIIAAIALRLSKTRLDRQFDIEYGKRRH
jgi:hypothetical protein